MNGPLATSGANGASATRRQFLPTLALGAGVSALSGESAGASVLKRLEIDLEPSPSRLPTALVTDEVSRCHVPAGHKPERPQRYDAVLGALRKSDFFSVLKPYQPRPATDEEILACHSRDYLVRVRRDIESGASRLSTGDTFICRQSLKAAHYASGAACVAVDAVLKGEAKNAFCLTRRPAIMPRRIAAWAFACSTTRPSPPAMRNANMAWARC